MLMVVGRADLLGCSVANFKIVQLLGAGATSSVYLGRNSTGREVALKVLHPRVRRSKLARRRLAREASILAGIDCLGVPKVLGLELAEAVPCMVLEHCPGSPLSALWNADPSSFTVDVVLRVAAQILERLAQVHANGVVHADVKPGNVIVSNTGRLTLVDFGCARSLASAEAERWAGTPAYMPPEQAAGRYLELGPTSDIWSLGAAMFLLLTGRHVHQASSANAARAKAAVLPAPPISDVLPNIATGVAHVIDRALEFDNASRWGSALEMLSEVRKIQRNVQRTPTRTDPSRAAVPPGPRPTPGDGAPESCVGESTRSSRLIHSRGYRGTLELTCQWGKLANG
ncbi:MAG: serine/threonine-protein kinase [Polyangiaceae bacterium]|nr:serine/threonine-protein kinase [Polyangiaceae bacterium]